MILTGVIYRPQDMIVMAMAAGMIQDLVMGNFFGLHLFPYLVVAFVMTLGGREKYNRQWFVSMTAVMGGTCLYILAAAAVIWAAGGHICLCLPSASGNSPDHDERHGGCRYALCAVGIKA